MMAVRFSHEDARRFYDRFGSAQDSQAFYENRALDALITAGGLDEAHAVLEFGCGTGRLAERLLREVLPEDARYSGIDISETMVGLARARLAPWADRAAVHQSTGGFDPADLGGPFDRVVATYVFDLLEDDDIRAGLDAAHTVLAPGGLLCTAALTRGVGPLSRVAMTLWSGVHWLRPALVGGCRPLVLADYLDPAEWRVVHRETIVSVAIPSEVLIAASQ